MLALCHQLFLGTCLRLVCATTWFWTCIETQTAMPANLQLKHPRLCVGSVLNISCIMCQFTSSFIDKLSYLCLLAQSVYVSCMTVPGPHPSVFFDICYQTVKFQALCFPTFVARLAATHTHHHFFATVMVHTSKSYIKSILDRLCL